MGQLHDLRHGGGIAEQLIEFFVQLRHACALPLRLLLQLLHDAPGERRAVGRGHDAAQKLHELRRAAGFGLLRGLLERLAAVAAGEQLQQTLPSGERSTDCSASGFCRSRLASSFWFMERHLPFFPWDSICRGGGKRDARHKNAPPGGGEGSPRGGAIVNGIQFCAARSSARCFSTCWATE